MHHRLLSLFSLLACESQELSQESELDRLRVLAVRAEPAEPRPGDTVTFNSFTYAPDDVGDVMTTWFACLPESADDYGCTIDEEVQTDLEETDWETLTPEEQAELYTELLEAGLIGVEPFLPPVWTVPEDALEGLDSAAALEGVSAVVTIAAAPADLAAGGAKHDASDGGSEDETADWSTDVELAFKRVPVSLATTPNHNPDIVSWVVNGDEVALDEVVSISKGEEIEIEPVLAEGGIETYDYTTTAGDIEARDEEPYFTWYLETGAFDQPWTLWPTTAVRWAAPGEPYEGAVHAVVRDRRGGMGWASLSLVVE